LNIGSRRLYIAGGIACVVLLAFASGASVLLWASVPPRAVSISTGAPGEAYQEFAERYRAILKKSGVELRLLPSAGAVENLARLLDRSSGVSVTPRARWSTAPAVA